MEVNLVKEKLTQLYQLLLYDNESARFDCFKLVHIYAVGPSIDLLTSKHTLS